MYSLVGNTSTPSLKPFNSINNSKNFSKKLTTNKSETHQYPFNEDISMVRADTNKFVSSPLKNTGNGTSSEKRRNGAQIPRNVASFNGNVAQRQMNWPSNIHRSLTVEAFVTPLRKIAQSHQHKQPPFFAPKSNKKVSDDKASLKTCIVENRFYLSSTPPSTLLLEDKVVPKVYAGSKFVESPQPKNIPLPPPNWIENIRCKKSQPELTNFKDGSSSSSSPSSPAPINNIDNSNMNGDIKEKSESVQLSGAENNSPPGHKNEERQSPSQVRGIRIHPLQLIASVSID